ncbi:MAG: phenylalanine 4-monooxygenase [Myxococcota bacterium]
MTKKSIYVAKPPDSRGYVDYTPEEDETWSILYQRQHKIIQGRACDEYLTGLELLAIPKDKVPQCPEISEHLKKATGWAVTPVPKIISIDAFFDLLANKHFPAATFIRTREELDYLKEPDIFHEFFGHCPLLTNKAYADFIESYGKMAQRADHKTRSILGRLFWFTIEFGLVSSAKGLRVYGGGILSSYTETTYALQSDVPTRLPFDIREVMKTAYRYDEIQKKYFVLDSLKSLFKIIQLDLPALAEKVALNTDQDQDFITC